MSLRISSSLSLPKEASLWTFGILAIKGSGKTYDACVLAEEMLKSGIPIVSLDSMGIWWSLRVGVDGNEGLPVVVFGGRHKDISIPSTINKGHELVDEGRLKDLVKAMLQTRISVVLDTSEYSKSQQRRIVGIFVEELVRLNSDYGVRHVFIEEADTVVPQRASGETAFVAGAINDLVRRGGNFNLGSTLISQRPAVVNKDVLTQINCLVALRILAKLDKKAVQTWVEEVAHPNDPRMAKFSDSLNGLKNGESWIWHPEDPEILKRIQFRKRETLHATREYFLQSKLDQANVKPLDVGEFVSRFKDKFEPKKEIPKPQTVPLAQKLTELSKWQQEQQITSSPGNRRPAEMTQVTRGLDYGTTRGSVALEPVVEGRVQVVQQSLPNIVIEQLKPTLTLSVEMLEQPSTIFGKVCVILKTTPAPSKHQYRWTQKIIGMRIKEHGWDDAGIEDVIGQLKRWEILNIYGNYLRFDPDRITVVEKTPEMAMN